MTRDRKPLLALKASAGAGKTHRLTNEYIDLLLGSEDCKPTERPSHDAYKHILAVTFTNKATDEMKSRIIETLYKISITEGNPRQKIAKEVLTRILHDYSYFSISTIDTFFQGTMRAFAREIGQYSSYRVEIDTNEIIQESIDKMISSIEDETESDVMKWLIEYSIDMIEEGRQWDITSTLLEKMQQFMREDFKLMKRQWGSVLNDKNRIRGYRDEMSKIILSYRRDLKELGLKAMAKMAEYSLIPEDYYRGKTGPFKYFEKISNGDCAEPSPLLAEMKDNPDGWYKKTSDRKDAIRASYYGGLNDMIGEVYDMMGERRRVYKTAEMVRNNLYMLGIFSDIYKTMMETLKEKNVILLGETAEVLNKIIDGSDTPFIYEKIGNRFDHYMLDEFQDTSALQWENLYPLVDNSVSKGLSNLIVGDVKQSIYRFRNSDWTLLDSKVDEQFDKQIIETEDLNENWRSSKHIVDFNNDLFASVSAEDREKGCDRQSINDIIATDKPEIGAKLNRIYSHSRQDLPDPSKKITDEGHVKLTFVPNDIDEDQYLDTSAKPWQNRVLSLLPDQIKKLLDAGYKPNDIAFLVRKGFESPIIANLLIRNGYKVMTEEALKIGTSNSVCKIVAFLKYIVNPEDPVNNILFQSDQIADIINFEGVGLFDICQEIIRDIIIEVPETDIPFVQTFLDCVLTYTQKNGSDLRGFVSWWDEVGSKQSISVPADNDAFQVMTIHKSKGLGFPVVILPFIEETFYPNIDHYIWVHPKAEPFSEIGLIPLNATSAMEQTFFADDYKKEMEMSYIDSVNTMYVAMTRPKRELFIYAPVPKSPGSIVKFKNFSDALYVRYESELVDNVYELGETSKPTESNILSDVVELNQTSFISEPIGKRLVPSLRSADFFDSDQQSSRLRGIVLHDILSKIKSSEDLPTAISDAVRAGEIKMEQTDGIIEFLSTALAEVADRHWFDGTYSVLNEISIVDGNGNVYRPDRVLIGDDSKEAIIIDYKFGKHKDSYTYQVKNYCNLLRKMGYSHIQGYIWYVGETIESI